jgi:uncharacterized protein YsxB (DUF464 family)
LKPLMLICLLAGALTLAACGQSSQDKAQKQVCSARSDIQKQVNDLKSLTPTTATLDGIKANFNSIRTDLQKIAAAQSQLNEQRKKQVQAANQAFVSQFQSIASDFGKSLSISGAQAKLQAAVQQLSAAYRNTFAKVDCGG